MLEPIEIEIIHAQQSFEIAVGPNSVQIEIDDDRVLNIFKKHKKVRYRIIPLGLFFPASIKNNTEQIFLSCRELNNVKKSLIDNKTYKKIINWEEIRGQHLWINATLEEQAPLLSVYDHNIK